MKNIIAYKIVKYIKFDKMDEARSEIKTNVIQYEKYYPKDQTLLLLWMDVMWHILNENFQLKLNFILLHMDEICYMCSLLPMWGCNEKRLTNESYHTTWRMKLFYERKWNFVINNFWMKLTNMNVERCQMDES